MTGFSWRTFGYISCYKQECLQYKADLTLTQWTWPTSSEVVRACIFLSRHSKVRARTGQDTQIQGDGLTDTGRQTQLNDLRSHYISGVCTGQLYACVLVSCQCQVWSESDICELLTWACTVFTTWSTQHSTASTRVSTTVVSLICILCFVCNETMCPQK